MKYTIEKQKTQFKIEMTLDKKEWEDANEQAYQKTKGRFNIQGFRKGKAPRRVIEQTYGTGVFFEDAIDGCFYKYYFEVLQKEPQIQPIDSPDIDIKDISDKGITLIVKVENKPEVKLGDYKNITIAKDEVKVGAKEIKAELDKMAQSRAKFVEVERAVKNGDITTIDFSGSIDGVKFEGGTGLDYDLEIGSKSFIDTFEEQIIGMKVGEQKDINVKFPENYHSEELKGKPATFEVKVKAIKEKVVPVVNDKFAEDCSEFSTLEELKKSIEKKLKDNADAEAVHKQEQEIIEKVTDNATVDIPEVLVKRQVEDFLKDFEYRLSYQGLKLDDYVKYMGTTVEQMKKDKEEDAKKTVKTRLVLEELIIKEKLDVTEEDILNKYNENKDKKVTMEELKKQVTDDQLAYMENGLLLNKVIKFLRENNNL